MDIFDSRYYKTNVFCLKNLGLWPFDNPTKNKLIRIIIIFIITSLLIPQAIRLVEEWGRDIDIVIEVVGSLIYFSVCQVKYTSFLRVESKMKYLYGKIAEHWTIISRNALEISKLAEFGEIGRTLTWSYLIPINICLVGYIALPLIPAFLDVINPLNETRPKAFPYFAEYFIDDQKYYFELASHGWISFVLSVQIFGTFDTTYTQCVQHACALFAIVEHRMKVAAKMESKKLSYKAMVDAISLHKETIEFVNLIEECYSFCFFIVITLNAAVISLTVVDVMLNIENGNTKQAVRIGMLYFGFSFHMLYNMCPGQRVVDSSTRVCNAAFHCDWFNTSPQTKKLVKIIMLRSQTPCQFTAGKLFLLDMESFTFVFKKSISYVTVVGSMRG